MVKAKSVAFVGHSGSGKSTLATALLKVSGIKEQIAFDPSEEEKKRGYSIDLGVGSFTWEGNRITLLDAPGGDEFAEEMYKATAVSDLSVIVLNGEKGVEVITERAWELTGAKNRPTALWINQMDRENVDFDGLISSLSEHFDGTFVPIQLPIGEEGFIGVVDLVANRAVYFADPSKKGVPAGLEAAVSKWRNYLLEEVSTLDDDLMMKFLEEEEITPAELASVLAKGVTNGAVTPLMCGSALEERGIKLLAAALVDLTPSPAGDREGPCAAVVFDVASDPYLGQLNYVRVIQGTLSEGGTYYDLSSGNKVSVRDLYSFAGTTQQRVPQARPGDIVGLGKVEGLQLGTTLAAEQGMEPFPPFEFPAPVYSRAVVPKSQSDVEKMSTALKGLLATKSTLRIERDPVTKETVMWGMGEIQLGAFLERLENRHNVSLDTRQPSIPYKETIRKQATAQYRHKKQTGGRGQFGEVYLRIEPHPSGDEAFEFLNEIKGGSIPGQYIPGVEKGVLEAMEEGNLASYPVTNITVAVFDGRFHPVDSSELAFKIAARTAFRTAMDQANPCILEPVMQLEVRTPDEYTGDIVSDLNGRRGRILGMEPATRVTKLKAEIPLAEVQRYALDLKSLTQGRATFQMRFLKYQPVPANLQEKIIAQAKADK
ncbi:MAG: elongation factor G [Candidatus Bipolaricaulota bacterium]|nr:elongation factor G [Candidatus Bipolaricaulota bacterium]